MNGTTAGEPAFATATPEADQEAIEFVRFCHRRRRVGWPELYDEMCAVVGRGLYRGYSQDDLAEIGIGLGLFQMPALAGLVARVVAEDVERRRRAAAAIRATVELDAAVPAGPVAEVVVTPSTLDHGPAPRTRDIDEYESASPAPRSMRLVPAGA
jgi:hypothetical protein